MTFDEEKHISTTPKISAAKVSSDRKLEIAGSDIQEGALLEINGKVAFDTRVTPNGLVSDNDWKDGINPGQPLKIAVINSDGGRKEIQIGSTHVRKSPLATEDERKISEESAQDLAHQQLQCLAGQSESQRLR